MKTRVPWFFSIIFFFLKNRQFMTIVSLSSLKYKKFAYSIVKGGMMKKRNNGKRERMPQYRQIILSKAKILIWSKNI